MTPPDVVIPVRRGERNEELRYALRSLRCLPHGRVWIAGHRPAWVAGCGHVSAPQTRTKHENSVSNLVRACRHPQISEEFILWNDDFFLLRPIDEVPVLHRGPMDEFVKECERLGRSPYARGVVSTAEILRRLGHGTALCYELHVPLPMTKAGLLAAHAAATAEGMPVTTALQIRSVYGNEAGLGGTRSRDVKVFTTAGRWTKGSVPFLSTADSAWGRHPAALAVKQLHPEPGPYEVAK